MTPFLLHLLRHGAPAQPGKLMGHTDGEPCEHGILDCIAKVRDLDVAAIAASDLRRARVAGDAVADLLSLPLTIDQRWREIDFGAWDGLTSDEIDPESLGRFQDDPDANPPPGGERWSALIERVGNAIGQLAPRPTLIITHGGAMRAALAHLCRMDHHQTWAFDLPYAARLSLKVWPGERFMAQIIGLS